MRPLDGDAHIRYPYFPPLIPWLEEPRTIGFPSDKKWKVEDKGLYERMREVLRSHDRSQGEQMAG